MVRERDAAIRSTIIAHFTGSGHLGRLTEQQRKQMVRERDAAIYSALIAYFTGSGSLGRIPGVIGRFAWTSLLWSIGVASLIVAALAALVITKADHAQFLLFMHTALGKGGYQEIHADAINVLVTSLKFGAFVGVPVGLTKALWPITDPARDAVLDKWRKTDDETGATA